MFIYTYVCVRMYCLVFHFLLSILRVLLFICNYVLIVVKYCVLFLMYLPALPPGLIPNCSGNKLILILY